jgi:hypothetical protein
MIAKDTIMWDITLCSLSRFRRNISVHDGGGTILRNVGTFHVTLRNIPKNSTLHSHRHEKLKSRKNVIIACLDIRHTLSNALNMSVTYEVMNCISVNNGNVASTPFYYRCIQSSIDNLMILHELIRF